MNNRILSLLGLALRGGRLAVGEEPAALAAKSGQSRLLVAASDAAANTLRRAEHLAEEGHCLWLVLPFTKEELGGALGRSTAAIAALTDTGLAAAVTERLAEQDPERYAEAAARMDLKRRRAKERQSAPHRDPPKKNPDRPPYRKGQPKDGERRPYGKDRPKGGERRPSDRGRPGGEHRPYDKDRLRDGERRSYDKDRPKGERHPYGKDRPGGAEHRSYGKDRPKGAKPGPYAKPAPAKGHSYKGNLPDGRKPRRPK